MPRHRFVPELREFPKSCDPSFSTPSANPIPTATEEILPQTPNKNKKPRLYTRYLPPLCGPSNENFVANESVERHFCNASNQNNKENSSLLSFSSSSSSDDVARNIVRSTLRYFHVKCRDLEAKPGKQIIGTVLGVLIGDEFCYWREFNIIGLHRQVLRGIDYVKHHNGKIVATSVVSSGSYDDEMHNTNELVYSGQGGNVVKRGSAKREPKDQKLVGGNLALKNSFEVKNPVRVILKSGSNKDVGGANIYVYYGLYEVEEYWQEIGSHGKLVYKFRLVRIPGQIDVAWNELKKSKSVRKRKGLCVDDVSSGKEDIPICVINTVDGERVPLFKYTAHMVYPKWFNIRTPLGCDCIDGCSDSKKCLCAVRNGGRIAFNKNKAIMAPKSIVYECGPFCKCSSTCQNRVSQNGIRFKLEVFRTKTKGWGVRSHNSIPFGSFICEYTGELLKDKEIGKMVNSDQYMFAIGNNYIDRSLWQELLTNVADGEGSSSSSCPVSKDGGFTIDAAHYGNVARFINHSSSPNLFAQNVLYDHSDKKIPHVMLFAGENIPRMQKLNYHYNQVYDHNGNIKKKIF